MTIAAVRAKFWTCDVTGLKVHDTAVPPLMANAVTGVVFLLVGGLLSVLIGLTRWEAVDLLPDKWYYIVLTLHAWSMLIFWIIFIEVAILYFACTAVLNARLVSPRAAWLAYAMMLGGAALAALTALLQGDTRDQPLLTSYVPLDIHPLFFVGAIIFAVGALLATCIFFATIYMAKRERTYEGSLPLVTFGAAIAAIIAVESLLGGAIAYIWQLLWTIGLVDSIDAEMYRVVWWLLGHGSQQINLVAMVAVWYLLAHLSTGAQSASEKVSRTGFVLYLLFINLGAAHHHLSDPGVTSAWRIWNAGYAMYGAAMASLIHAFAIPASIELALRKQGHGGLFGWLRHAPWGNPAFAALAVSLPLFGILGGITGITFGTEQLNMMVHNTLAIPGHFHGTVVAGTTIAFMGVAYAVIWLIGLREILSEKLATLQIYVFGVGMAVFVVAMMWMGYFFGIPRRHPDVSSLAIIRSPSLETIMGFAGVVAILGGVLFLALAVGTLLFGTRREKGLVVATVGGPSGGQAPVPAEHTSENGMAHDLRGTLTLSFVFFVVFVVIYATQLINLSSLWSIS